MQNEELYEQARVLEDLLAKALVEQELERDRLEDPKFVAESSNKFPIPTPDSKKPVKNSYPSFMGPNCNNVPSETSPKKKEKNPTSPINIDYSKYSPINTTPVQNIKIVDPNTQKPLDPNVDIFPPTPQYSNVHYVDGIPQEPFLNPTARSVPTNLNIDFSQGDNIAIFTPEDAKDRLGHVEAFRILNQGIILANSGILSSRIRITYYRDKELADLFSLIPGVRNDHHRLTLGVISNLTIYIYDKTKQIQKYNRPLMDDLKKECHALFASVARAIDIPAKRFQLLNDASASVTIIDNLCTVGVHSRCFNSTDILEIAKLLNAIAETLATFLACVSYKSKRKVKEN